VIQAFFHAAALTGRTIDHVLLWVAHPAVASEPTEILREHPHAAPSWHGLLQGALYRVALRNDVAEAVNGTPHANPRVTRRVWAGLVSVSDWQRICTVTTLADAVLPLIRTRADLSRWSASSAHGRQMHEAVDILQAAVPTTDVAEVYAVTHKALASAIKVIARPTTPAGSSVVPAVVCSSSIPQSLRRHRCRPAVWSTG
jgi:hypothetical protein